MPNAIGRVLGLLGDPWNLLLVQQAFLGATRFADFGQRLPISAAVLTNRLRLLVERGLLAQVDGARGYRLTACGRELWTVLLAIWAWERRWVPAQHDALPAMVHTGCGESFEPVLTCGCGGTVAAASLEVAWGPSGGWSRSVPLATTRRGRSGRGATPSGLFPDTLAVVGDRWSLALVGAALLGCTTFTDHHRALGAPAAVVVDRLRGLVAVGVLRPADPGYRLTAKGVDLAPVVLLAVAWGERWFGVDEGPALVVRHLACGEVTSLSPCCGRCGAGLRAGAVETRPVQPVQPVQPASGSTSRSVNNPSAGSPSTSR